MVVFNQLSCKSVTLPPGLTRIWRLCLSCGRGVLRAARAQARPVGGSAPEAGGGGSVCARGTSRPLPCSPLRGGSRRTKQGEEQLEVIRDEERENDNERNMREECVKGGIQKNCSS